MDKENMIIRGGGGCLPECGWFEQSIKEKANMKFNKKKN